MVQIVAITGYAGHGKDTAADILVHELGFAKMSFADALRRMAYRVNPIIGHHVSIKQSQQVSKFLWFHWSKPTKNPEVSVVPIRLQEVVDKIGWDRAKREYPEIRNFLQKLATEGVRDVISCDAWIQALDRAIKESKVERVVIADLRFFNEEQYCKQKGALTLRVINPRIVDNGVGKTHASEAFIEKIQADYALYNDGTLEDLRTKLLPMVISHLNASQPPYEI